MRGATRTRNKIAIKRIPFQSTRPMRGATRSTIAQILNHVISIHAPHAGRDPEARDSWRRGCHFNPRAPCGARLWPLRALYLWTIFQSTRPMRGATRSPGLATRSSSYFNPRAPCGARQVRILCVCSRSLFQSTRPMRGATNAVVYRMLRNEFQSTRPMRGATARSAGCRWCLSDFNPRAPCGARLQPDLHGVTGDIFQSTRPMRGATTGEELNHIRILDFNPRAPCGARPPRKFMFSVENVFQSTRPMRGATMIPASIPSPLKFQSTRPMRGATAKVNKLLCTFLQKRHGFQIFLRKTLPFKAFCRLQIGKNFSICGANRCGNFCELLLRTIRSSVLPEGRSACSQNAQFYSHTFSRDNRNADCLFPDP